MFVIEIAVNGENGWVKEGAYGFIFSPTLREATFYATELEAACTRCYIERHLDPTIVKVQNGRTG